MKNIAVVGGGVVGLSCAAALVRDGHRVTVFDDSRGREAASWGNAGHVAIEQVAPLASAANLRSIPKRLFALGGAVDLPWRMAASWAPFALRLVAASSAQRFAAGCAALEGLLSQAMPAWVRLSSALGRPDLLRMDGHFVVWESAAGAAAGRDRWVRANIGTARIEAGISDRDMDRLRAVGGSKVADAVRFRQTGQIRDLTQLADALEQAILGRGGSIRRERAMLTLREGRVSIPGHEAELVVLAAGVRSRSLAQQAGHRVPLVAERGYHLRAAAGRWPADLPPVVFEDRSMIVTRFADRVQAASFLEFGDPDSPPDPRKWRRLERHVAELGLPLEEPFERWMGSRPTLPDYLPAIGRSRRVENLLYAFGHQHLGLTLAPVTSEILAALVNDSDPKVDLTPFDLDRFQVGAVQFGVKSCGRDAS